MAPARDMLGTIMGEYMKAQIEAGAQVIQIFDSWAGALSSADYREFVLPHTRKIFEAIRGTGVPTIHFGTGTANILQDLREAGGDVIGADWRIPLDEAWDRIGYDRAIQGNLDPTLLLAPLDRMLTAADDVLERAGGRPGTSSISVTAFFPRRRSTTYRRSHSTYTGTDWRMRNSRPETELVDVAVVGAGVSGLAAAYELRKRKRSVIVLERERPAGGVIVTERVGEFIIDAGPDSLLVQKPAAVTLCNELGLGDRLFPTKLPRTAFVLRGGELHPLPAASILGFPTRLEPLFNSTLFRLAGEIEDGGRNGRPACAHNSDESIAAFVRRRFGPEAVTYIAEPLLAGIHAGDAERLSMRALFPRLLDAEARAGSVIKAFRREHGAAQLRRRVPVISERPGGTRRRADESRSKGFGAAAARTSPASKRPTASRFTLPAAVDPRARRHPRHSGVRSRGAPASDRCRTFGGMRIDSLPVDRDGRLRVSTRRGSTRSAGHRLRGTSRRRHQHHRRSVDLVEMAQPGAGRTSAAARVSGRCARS